MDRMWFRHGEVSWRAAKTAAVGACPARGQGGGTHCADSGRRARLRGGGSGRSPAASPRWGVLLLQDLGGNGQVAVRVQQVARAGEAVLVVAKVDLAQARVDARVRRGAHRLLQASAGVGARGEAARLAGDVEGPRPWHQAPVAPDAALQGHGVEHGRGDACALGSELVSRWRNLLGQGGTGIQAGSEHQCAQGHGYGWRCHGRSLAHGGGQIAGQASDSQRPPSWLSVMLRARAPDRRSRAWPSRGCAHRPGGCRPCRGRTRRPRIAGAARVARRPRSRPDEHRRAATAAHACGGRQIIGEVHSLHAGVQALPRFVVGALVGKPSTRLASAFTCISA